MLPAIAFGFSGQNADGSSSELNLQYATVHGDDVVLITAAAYDEGDRQCLACNEQPGSEFGCPEYGEQHGPFVRVCEEINE